MSIAIIDSGECIACGSCVGVCPVEALSMVGNIAVVDEETCVGCGNCVGECPVDAITLSGGGNPTPILNLGLTELSFGDVATGTTRDLVVTVSNTGGGTLTGTATTVAPYSIISGGSYSLTSGQSQNVAVRFTPSGTGAQNGSVSFSGGAGGTVTCTGTGVLSQDFEVSVGTLNFGTVTAGNSTVLSFTVTNISGVQKSGSASVNTPFSIESGGSWTLVNQGTQLVEVRFSPTQAGTFNQVVAITGGLTVNVTGVGQAPQESGTWVSFNPNNVVPNDVDKTQQIRCRVTYNGMTAIAEQTLTDVTDGVSVSLMYSSNGSGNPDSNPDDWHATFDSQNDKWMVEKLSTGSWSAAKKIVGEDGGDGARGFGIYSAFHTNDIDNTPTKPADNWNYKDNVAGASNGWTAKADPTQATVWMTMKATDGLPIYNVEGNPTGASSEDIAKWNNDSWSSPIRLKGDKGTSTEIVVKASPGYTASINSGEYLWWKPISLPAYSPPPGYVITHVKYSAQIGNTTNSEISNAEDIFYDEPYSEKIYDCCLKHGESVIWTWGMQRERALSTFSWIANSYITNLSMKLSTLAGYGTKDWLGRWDFWRSFYFSFTVSSIVAEIYIKSE